MANKMMGLLPPDIIDKGWEKAIDMLSDNSLWNDCEKAIETALSRFEKKGIELPEKEYLYSILLANPDNAYTIMNRGILRRRWYSGIYNGLACSGRRNDKVSSGGSRT